MLSTTSSKDLSALPLVFSPLNYILKRFIITIHYMKDANHFSFITGAPILYEVSIL